MPCPAGGPDARGAEASGIGLAGLDVSNQRFQDDVLARLLTFPNVLVNAVRSE